MDGCSLFLTIPNDSLVMILKARSVNAYRGSGQIIYLTKWKKMNMFTRNRFLSTIKNNVIQDMMENIYKKAHGCYLREISLLEEVQERN